MFSYIFYRLFILRARLHLFDQKCSKKIEIILKCKITVFYLDIYIKKKNIYIYIYIYIPVRAKHEFSAAINSIFSAINMMIWCSVIINYYWFYKLVLPMCKIVYLFTATVTLVSIRDFYQKPKQKNVHP